jgi:hypothetical protein
MFLLGCFLAPWPNISQRVTKSTSESLGSLLGPAVHLQIPPCSNGSHNAYLHITTLQPVSDITPPSVQTFEHNNQIRTKHKTYSFFFSLVLTSFHKFIEILTLKHTHTHTQRERERERERVTFISEVPDAEDTTFSLLLSMCSLTILPPGINDCLCSSVASFNCLLAFHLTDMIYNHTSKILYFSVFHFS